MEDDCEEIFTMIESAIFSAASEYPREFSVRRSRIAEILFTVLKEPCNSSQQNSVATQKSNTKSIPELMYHGGNYFVKPTTTHRTIRHKSSAVPKADQVCGQARQNMKIKKTKEEKEQPRHISKTKKTNIPTQEELNQRLLELYQGRKHLIGQNTSPVKPTTGKVEEERKHLIFKIRLRPKEGQEQQKPKSDRVAVKHTTIPSIDTATLVPEKSSAGLINKSKPIIKKEAKVHQQVRKRERLDDEAIQQKLEASKKKLKTGYEQVQEAKERKKIQMIELQDLPRKPVERCCTQKFKRPPIRTRFY